MKKSATPYWISDGFEVTFCDDCPYTPKWFREGCCIQMKFIVRGSHLKRLGKEYQAGTPVSKKNTFLYHIKDEVCSDLGSLIGGELVKLDSESGEIHGGNTKHPAVDIYVRCLHEPNSRRLSLRVARDGDTCFDGIDRMALTADISSVDSGKLYCSEWESNLPYPHGCIKKIKIFESTIAGERDRVIYDSHLMMELESGEKIIFRAEPNGEEMLTVFTDVEDNNMERYLRVSGIWFVHAALIFDENNEVIGLKHFYQTETKVR